MTDRPLIRYRAVLNTSASCTVTFEAPVDATEEELISAADGAEVPTLCHHCGSKQDLTLGDDWDVDSYRNKLQVFPET